MKKMTKLEKMKGMKAYGRWITPLGRV